MNPSRTGLEAEVVSLRQAAAALAAYQEMNEHLLGIVTVANVATTAANFLIRLCNMMADYLLTLLNVPPTDVERESLPLILRALTGLVVSHVPTQRILFEKGVLPVLHQLETIASSKKQIGSFAENVVNGILKYEGGDKQVAEAMMAIRQATIDEKKRLALAQRQKLVADLSTGIENFEGFDDLEDEEGLVCMVCRRARAGRGSSH